MPAMQERLLALVITKKSLFLEVPLNLVGTSLIPDYLKNIRINHK